MIILISVVLIWFIAAQYTNPIFIPSPVKVFNNLIEAILNGQLWIAFWYSFRRIAIASILAAVIAIPIGLLIYNFKFAKDYLYPIVSVMRYMPVTAFYPLLIMWFGIDETMKVVFLFIATFVYMMPSVMLALDEVSEDLIDTGLTLGMNKLQTITMIQLPATLPSICNSFVMCLGISFTYICVAETVNAKYGLGWIIQQSSSRGRTDMVFMGIIVIVFMSVILDATLNKIIKTKFKWRYLEEERGNK